MADSSKAKLSDASDPTKSAAERTPPNLDASRHALTEPAASKSINPKSGADAVAAAGLPPGDQVFRPSEATDKQGASAPQFPLKEKYDPLVPYTNSDGKPTARGQELSDQASALVKEQAGPDGALSLRGHGEILKKIAEDKSLSEADKWYEYKRVCQLEAQGRDRDGRLIPGTTDFRVLFDLAPPKDLERSRKGDVVRHLIIDPTDDAYHGGLLYGSRGFGAGFLRDKAGIRMHELLLKPIEHALEGFPIDRGDEHASFRQLRALKAMQSGGFDAYSKAWRHEFAE